MFPQLCLDHLIDCMTATWRFHYDMALPLRHGAFMTTRRIHDSASVHTPLVQISMPVSPDYNAPTVLPT